MLGPTCTVGADRFYAAIVQTEVIDGFYVRHTANLDESIQFLADLTRDIVGSYVVKSGCYPAFLSLAHLRLLVQVDNLGHASRSLHLQSQNIYRLVGAKDR